MAYSVTKAADDLEEDVRWQITPEPLTIGDYEVMIQNGIKRLYVDTGRALSFNPDGYSREENHEILFGADFAIDEEEYIMLCAKIDFFKTVQSKHNAAVSYQTDALSVTGADKPYAHLKDSIQDLERRRRELFYRMVRYAIDYVVDE